MGTFSVTFTMYNAPIGGLALWSELQNVTTDTEGRFNVLLGSVTALTENYFSAVPRYLGTAVSPDPEMTPRVQITSVGFAHRISTVDGASGGSITSSVSIGTSLTNSGNNSLVVGQFDSNTALSSTVAGGSGNANSGISGFIGGGLVEDSNAANGNCSTVAGGQRNIAAAAYTSVGGGVFNTSSTQYSAISGGTGNEIQAGQGSFIGGGTQNIINSGGSSTIVGGQFNENRSTYGFIGAGVNNVANGPQRNTICGGGANFTDGFCSTIGGGISDTARGDYAVVPGGYGNTADGDYAFAAGHWAGAMYDGSFAWADNFGSSFNTTAANQFIVRATGGIGLGTNAPYSEVTVDGTLGFTNGAVPLIYMYESGSNNALRQLFAHSPSFSDWGLGYHDSDDEMIYFSSGNPVMSVDLTNTRVGIGKDNPTNILQVVQSSSTDPIADSWTVYSSRRWKEDIMPIRDALAKVERLQGVTYKWKTDGKRDIGLIAEEVGRMVPEIVAYEANGVDAKSVDYARLVAVLIEAVKEQQAQIQRQNERLQALETATATYLSKR